MPEQDDTGQTMADWLSEQAGRPVTFEHVEPGDEQVLPDAEQRELDGLPSALALRYESS